MSWLTILLGVCVLMNVVFHGFTWFIWQAS
jgi:regulatory protein YycH of two-component signal transduction system YycFG